MIMNITSRVLVISLCFGFVSSGCSSLNDVMEAKLEGNEGMSRTYPVNEEQAWNISRIVFLWEGADAIEKFRERGFMLTSSGMTLFTPGTVMGAWIETLNERETRVTVITKRRVTTNPITTLTESTFHRRFAQAVSIINSGMELPLVAPEM